MDLKNNKIGAIALALMVFTSVYGFTNIPLAFSKMGYAAIPFFIIGALLYFIPFSLMVAEMGQAFKKSQGGMYTWMEESIGIKFAFTGIFMYWVSNAVYLVGKATSSWIPLSFAGFGKNVFTDANINKWSGLSASQAFGIAGIVFVLVVTIVSIKGIKEIKKLTTIGGVAVLSLNLLLFIGGLIVLFTNGLSLGETNVNFLTSPNMNFSGIIASFGFLVYAIFAFGGMEATAGLVDEVKSEKAYVRGLFISGIVISIGYAIGVFFIGTFTNWKEVILSTDINGEFLVNDASVPYIIIGHLGLTLGNIFGMENPRILMDIFARFTGLGMFCSFVGAFFTLVYAPLKQMIEGTPKDIWPLGLSEIDKKNGTPKKGLIAQTIIVLLMIIFVSFGGSGAQKFFGTLQSMTNIAITLPYLFISIAYIAFLKKDSIKKPFLVLGKNQKFGLLAGWITTLTVAFANIFSILDLDNLDTGIMGINIPYIYDSYILGPVIFTLIAYLIVHRYELKKLK